MDKLQHIPLGDNGAAGFAVVSSKDYARVMAAGVWSLDNSNGYVCRMVPYGSGKNRPRRKQYLHRFILGLRRGDNWVADHIDGNPLNNSRQNLRKVKPNQNNQNISKTRGSSKFRGVHYSNSKKRWIATATVNGKTWSKSFTTELLAALAADKYRLANMPFAVPDPVLVEVQNKIMYAGVTA